MPDSASGSAPAALAIASRCSAIARPDSKPSLAAAAAARSTSGRVIPARSAASGTRSHRASASSSCRSASPGAWTRCASHARRHRGRERPRQVVRAVPVAGELGLRRRGVGLHRPCQRRVQRGPLAGQQVLVDRLADERVPEGVRPVGVGDEQLVRDGLARAVVDVAGEHGLQQLVADRPLGHGRHAHDLLGGARQALEAPEQRVAQRGRELAGVGGGGQQLLGVEGVALRPRVQAVGQAGIGLVVEDAGELLDHLVAAEALQRHPLDARGALQLGEDGTQRMAAVELVGAVGGEQEERLGPRVADEEDEEVARGGVGPVEVLDHQRDGAEPVQQGEQRLEHLRLARRRRAPTRRAAAAPRRAARRGRSCRRAPGSGRRGLGCRRPSARASNSDTRRLLPTPDSPATKAKAGMRSSAASSTASSSVRPTKVLLETRRNTTSIVEAVSAGSALTGRRRWGGAGRGSGRRRNHGARRARTCCGRGRSGGGERRCRCAPRRTGRR